MNKGRRTFIQGAAVVGAGLVAAREASGVSQQKRDDMQDMKNIPDGTKFGRHFQRRRGGRT